MALSMNGGSDQSMRNIEEENTDTIRRPTFDFADHDVDSDADHDEHPGDYSTRMEELFEGGEEDLSDSHTKGDDSEEEDEGFLYTGVDAGDLPTGYQEQLRDVLGSELSDDDELEMHGVERALIIDDMEKKYSDDEALVHEDILPERTPSTSSLGLMTPQRMASPGITGVSSPKIARPFPHPTVSRLRSSPYSSRLPSNGSDENQHSNIPDGVSPSLSHFSSMSRVSSVSNLHTASSDNPQVDSVSSSDREVFKWGELRNITQHLFPTSVQKASAVLGSPTSGSPAVLAANGLVCLGTNAGKIYVYDFRQTLKCICGDDSSAKTVGPVTALALSHDHTYVASGHDTGYIQIFDLKTPQTPARSVPPTTLGAVASGRKEGHLQGSRIVRIGFIAGRHTSIVSADDHGLAFFHRLGKVLFIEASDVLRILGKYQQDEIPGTPRTSLLSGGTSKKKSLPIPDTSFPRHRKTRHTILDMMPLPLGTFPHATDAYNVIALLTPTKLVVVGLKPTPRTWFKCPRQVDEGGSWRSKSKWKGNLAWFPSVLPSSMSVSESNKQIPAGGSKQLEPTTPILVYTWGNAIHLIRVTESRAKEMSRNPRTGKTVEIEVGRIVYSEVGKWSADGDILAVQWLNANQVLVLTAATLDVYDIHILKLVERAQFDGLSLFSPTLGSTINPVPYLDPVSDVGHSLRVYKGKIFVLSREHIRVGTLLTWADRILSFVQDGDFLNAIELARSYYVGEAPGNKNGLPDDIDLRKELVGGKMRDLLVASARYAFSEDRMTDGTHATLDGRGVDRTLLFEGLVAVACRACVALDDLEFLFEDLFQHYDDTGITKIYLQQLEPFILSNDIRSVPPRITQRLVALHEEDGRPDYAERIIWHIDPACLDINQAINLCQMYDLYDALIYIYIQAMQDYVAPIVELLGLIRKVRRYRKYRESAHADDTEAGKDAVMEPVIMNAYKVYPYLSNILSGISYPSEQPLTVDETSRAKEAVYKFIFSGCSTVWPEEDGELVLTSDEDGGVEPTYPYARQLLRFDAESFLHSLDIAFEVLGDDIQRSRRLAIIGTLLEIISSGDLQHSDVTFVNIFVARNASKYGRYLSIAPSTLHRILVGLAEDPDPDTREDRQLAAEHLLSVYNPRESEHIIDLFTTAGFYRILQTRLRRERRWAPLLSAYLADPDIHSSELFRNADGILAESTGSSKGSLPPELLGIISSALPRLLRANLTNTAILVDKYMPDLHELALQNLDEDADRHRFLYLRRLLGPPHQDDNDENIEHLASGPSHTLPSHLRQLYVSLQCRYHPEQLIDVLRYLPLDFLDWEHVQRTCEDNEVYYAVVWATNRRGDPQEALRQAERYQKRLTLKMVQDLALASGSTDNIRHDMQSLQSIAQTGISICLEHSHGTSENDVSLEDIWFQLLSSQINCVQVLSGYRNDSEGSMDDTNNVQEHVLTNLRALVQTTFTSFVSISASRAVSFPHLFKRLVNSASTPTGTQYTEFRIILTGMLESYRSDGDMLVITKHLVDRDLFEAVSDVARERARGWAPNGVVCTSCQNPLRKHPQSDCSNPNASGQISIHEVIVSRTGSLYHSRCLPPDP